MSPRLLKSTWVALSSIYKERVKSIRLTKLFAVDPKIFI